MGSIHRQFAFICLLFITVNTHSLMLLELRVPEHVALGERIHLECRWQLGRADVLYSVKWYKDGNEFFRFVPRNAQPQMKFLLPGVDVEASNIQPTGSNLTLSPVTLDSQGRYHCEVSGEKPLFRTVSNYTDMLVTVLPTQGPTLTGFHWRYHPGEILEANCTAGYSRPPTELAWYVNGEPPSQSAVLGPWRRELEGLTATTGMLKFALSDENFKKEGVKVMCLATISSIYWRSHEETAIRERVSIIPGIHSDRTTRTDRVHANHAIRLPSVFTEILCTIFICSFI